MVIAGALAQIASGVERSAILLLDEPTASLDLAYQLEVAALLRDLRHRMRIAIVVARRTISDFAASVCDRWSC